MTVETFDQLQQRIPERIVEHAVRGMLPKGRVSYIILTQLCVCLIGYKSYCFPLLSESCELKCLIAGQLEMIREQIFC